MSKELIETIKICAVVYSAFVSTIALIWTMINSIYIRKGEFNVELSLGFELPVSLLSVGLSNPVLMIRITNTGQVNRFVDAYMLKVSRLFKKNLYYQPISLLGNEHFPIELKVGDVCKKNYEIKEIKEYISGRGRLSILVKDTHGKKYFSKKIPLKQIREYYKEISISNN